MYTHSLYVFNIGGGWWLAAIRSFCSSFEGEGLMLYIATKVYSVTESSVFLYGSVLVVCRMVIRLIVSCTFFLCLLCVLYMDVYQIVCGAAEEGTN